MSKFDLTGKADLREFDVALGVSVLWNSRARAITAVAFDQALVERSVSVDRLVCQILNRRLKAMRADKKSLVRALAEKAGIGLAAISK